MSKQDISKSAHKLVPHDASSTMVIRDLTPEITTFSTPFLRIGLLKIGGRGTLIKLKTGNLAIFSPVALTDEVKAKLQSFSPGEVKYIIAPDFEHHIFVSPWAKAFPNASVIGVEGLAEKREKDPQTKGTTFQHVFTASNKRDLRISPEFDEEFEYEYVDAHVNKELVLFHKPSRTLIQADLIFSLPATEQFSKTGEDASGGLLTKFFSVFANTRGDMVWQRRLLYYGSASSNRKAFAESARRMRAWGEFERMIPCHGDVIERGGSRILQSATAWFVDGK